MKGHVHADLMIQYAEDAKTTDKPWELWELLHANRKDWLTMKEGQNFYALSFYRRKPKLKLIHGVEVPDISFKPMQGETFYYPSTSTAGFYAITYFSLTCSHDQHRLNHGLCYQHTEQGKQAAILHAKAMLGIKP